MKIQQRILLHLFIAIAVYVLILTITIPFALEIVLPKLGIAESEQELYIVLLFCIDTVLTMTWVAWYIGSPILIILKWIAQLAAENFEPFASYEKSFNRKGKRKLRFRLYEEVLTQLEKMRLQLMEAKIERGKVDQAKRDWIAGISHDLKTPLTYIKGYTTLLLKREYTWSPSEQLEFIEEIDTKGKHMEQLISDLNLAMQIEHSTTIPMHKTTQNIVPLIQQMIADISNDPRAKEHTFSLETMQETYAFELDPELFKRALQNIYMNAILHNPSAVHIETSLEKRGDYLIIYILDNGVGMDKETLQVLFKRYYRGTTTDKHSDGTGLGMAITKSLIEAHRGTIEVESEQGEGTRFTVSLPVTC